ncbi:transcriptional activator MN1 [Trichomycterus rosablanca]|uniref:transcriptional activator MN1 n=1 Tax=Trichomycterus rosablanca TaxID=2290929 RepID=UPI002F359399
MSSPEPFSPQINSGNRRSKVKQPNLARISMSSHYKSPGFHTGSPTGTVEAGMSALNEPPMLTLGMNMNGDQYGGFHSGGHTEVHPEGLKQQPHASMHRFFSNQQPQNNPHSHHQGHPQHHTQFGGNFDNDGARSSCLHRGRMMSYGGGMGPQQGFTDGFNPIAEAQSGDGFSQQQRLNPMSDFHHRSSTGNHPVPAPCLPLDQSPNRAASFHGLPSSSSSSENHNLESRRVLQQGNVEGLDYNYANNPPSGNFEVSVFSPSESDPQLSHQFGAGRQVPGSNFPGNSGMQQPPGMQGHSKRPPQAPSQQHHGMFFERLAGGCKMDPSARHPIMQQQQTGMMGRPSTVSLPAQPETGSTNAGLQDGGVMPGQHNHFEYPVPTLENRTMPSYGDHAFNMQQQLPPPQHPPSQRLQHFDPAYLNVPKRRRFDFPNAHRGESCGAWNSSMPNPAGMENHVSPTNYPEFAPSDGFSALQHVGPEQHRQNAAMMIKQMACRSQQQSIRQPNMQQLGHHEDVPQGPMVQRGSAGGMSIPGFERDSGRRMVNFDAQNPHMAPEGGWFSGGGPHPPGEMLGQRMCDPGAEPVAHDVHQNGAMMFRQGVNGLGMQEPIRGEGHMQALHSPGVHPQFGSSMGNLAQMQSPGASGHPNDFSGQALGAQASFPFGGSSRQGASHNNAQGVSTPPASYTTQSSEFSAGQHSSVSKLGAVSLGSLTKTGSKDSVFGQSCLAALSTACQNMIASLGAPNLNVSFNKKGQTEGKRKLSQTEQDANNIAAVRAGGPGSEYFPAAGTLQSSLMSGAGNNNTKPGGPNQTVQGEASALSPGYNMDATPCIEGKAATGGGRGRGRRKKDVDHASPGNLFSSENGNPVVSPSAPIQDATETPEKTHTPPSWGNKTDLMLDDESDLMSSLDSGFQSLSKSADCSPRVGFASPSYGKDDVLSIINSSTSTKVGHSPLASSSSPKLQIPDSELMCGQKGPDVGHTNHSTSSSECYRATGHPSTPGLEQARTPSSTSGQDEIHPLEILQAQIQLQRQQFSISEDQPLGVKKGKKGSKCAEDRELGGCSPGAEKGPMDTIDLDILMAEQHATWFVPTDKGSEEDKSLAAWEKSKEEGTAKEDADAQTKTPAGGGAPGPNLQRLSVHCTDELADPSGHAGPVPSWRSLHSDISNRFGTFVAALT